MKEIWFLRYHYDGMIGVFERYFPDEFSISRWISYKENAIGHKIVVEDVYTISLTEVSVE